jgi:hypothetical protein
MTTKRDRSTGSSARALPVLLVLLVLPVLVSSCWKGSKNNNDDNDAGDTDTGTDSDTDTDTDADTDTDTDSDTDLPADCTGLDDFTLCSVVTEPDRSYDICVDGICVSPGCGDATCNAPGPHFPLPDTNQRLCYDAAAEISCPSEGQDFYGQDAQYGWDIAHESSERFTRDMTTSSVNPLVADNVTGLVWQGCTAGLTDASCATGTPTTYTWVEALAYCDGLSWGGFDDWRLPDEYELESITDAAALNPAIDTTSFPEMPDGYSLFWSSSTYAGNVGYGWSVYFSVSFVGYGWTKGESLYVRCVRGGPTPHSDRFVRDTTSESGQPTVTDNATELEWQGCAQGLLGDSCETGMASLTTWSVALAYCEGLSWGGHDDWRLPNKKELRSIVDNHLDYPPIDAPTFPETPTSFFWSSSSFIESVASAWRVSFADGDASPYGGIKTIANYSRCVRGGDWD